MGCSTLPVATRLAAASRLAAPKIGLAHLPTATIPLLLLGGPSAGPPAIGMTTVGAPLVTEERERKCKRGETTDDAAVQERLRLSFEARMPRSAARMAALPFATGIPATSEAQSR